MEKKLLFLAKLFIFSVILFACRACVSWLYGLILKVFANAVLFLFRADTTLELTGDTFFNVEIGLIPFLSLVLATTRVEAAKKIRTAVLGLSILLLIDLTLICLESFSSKGAIIADEGSAAYTIYRTILLILPIVLWFSLVYKNLTCLSVEKKL